MLLIRDCIGPLFSRVQKKFAKVKSVRTKTPIKKISMAIVKIQVPDILFTRLSAVSLAIKKKIAPSIAKNIIIVRFFRVYFENLSVSLKENLFFRAKWEPPINKERKRELISRNIIPEKIKNAYSVRRLGNCISELNAKREKMAYSIINRKINFGLFL